MTSPAPSVTVMIRPTADETTTRDGRPLANAATAYVAGWTGFICEGKSFCSGSACKAFRPRWRDGLTTTAAAALRRRWLLEGAGAAFQHVLTASTVMYVV